MNIKELEKILSQGEDSRHQFKEKIQSTDKLAAEIGAFANSSGGFLFIGISDNCEVIGLEKNEVAKLNQWISNVTTSRIDPPLFVHTEILTYKKKRILIIDVPKGVNKPYAVNKSVFWVKNGADKRRATREELFRLMQSSKILFADEMETEVSIDSFDHQSFNIFYEKYYKEEIQISEISSQQLLKNLKLVNNNHLTLAGILLFGLNPHHHRPYFCIKATYFDGSDISVDNYRDKESVSGTLINQFKEGIYFIKRNLHRIQRNNNFNAPGELEIPEIAISEAVANAIVHRDYFINSPIFINIFHDRLEIISPGTLPNTITEENIKYGIHIQRNPIILSILERDKLFKYTGRGSGIPRMLKACNEENVCVDLYNDLDLNQFKVIFLR